MWQYGRMTSQPIDPNLHYTPSIKSFFSPLNLGARHLEYNEKSLLTERVSIKFNINPIPSQIFKQVSKDSGTPEPIKERKLEICY